jgi:hypothetical protein
MPQRCRLTTLLFHGAATLRDRRLTNPQASNATAPSGHDIAVLWRCNSTGPPVYEPTGFQCHSAVGSRHCCSMVCQCHSAVSSRHCCSMALQLYGTVGLRTHRLPMPQRRQITTSLFYGAATLRDCRLTTRSLTTLPRRLGRSIPLRERCCGMPARIRAKSMGERYRARER